MQRLSKKQVLWLAFVLALLTLFFFLDFPLFARSETRPPIASGTSVSLITADNLTYYAFPLLDIQETTLYKPSFELGESPSPDTETVLRQRTVVNDSNPQRATSVSEEVRSYAKEEVQELIRIHSANVGIDSTIPLRIGRCESNYNPLAKNRTSSAGGVFQYLESTFSNTQAGKQGHSRFEADANIRMAVSHMAVHGYGAWNASKSCWNI